METMLMYTDFSKAFDKVNHTLVDIKLAWMGFYGKKHSWLMSYLSGRILIVRFENTVSRPIEVSPEVPQGSHLGPFIFDLVIDDSPTVLKYCQSLKYADDMKIFLDIRSEGDCRKMQSEFGNMV
jgi:Reverse transcriptase (RNA-dependent DNA polymerase)